MSWLGLCSALQALSAALAVRVWRQRPEHGPIAIFLVTMVAANISLWALRSSGLAVSQIPAEPLVGSVRAWSHVGVALSLLWSAGLAAMFVKVFLGKNPWPVALVYIGAVVVQVASYPGFRGQALQQAYLGAELASLAICFGSMIQWVWRRKTPTLTQSTALLILTIELGMLVGPYRGNIFTDWSMAQGIYCGLYVIISILQGGSSWGSTAESKSP